MLIVSEVHSTWSIGSNQHLLNQRPTRDSAELIRKLAEDQKRPELTEDGMWRREQIHVVIQDILRKLDSPIDLHEMLLLPRLQRSRHPKIGWRILLPTKASAILLGLLLISILAYRFFLG
jgi:hypothetical protein